jgi:hypothetical protein
MSRVLEPHTFDFDNFVQCPSWDKVGRYGLQVLLHCRLHRRPVQSKPVDVTECVVDLVGNPAELNRQPSATTARSDRSAHG